MVQHGVLIVDKPSGMTSHDVVAVARRCFGTSRVGHAGTLDPLATGVLVLLFGEATKLSRYLAQANKRYLATVTFGRATDTLDAEGTTVEERALHPDFLQQTTWEATLERERERKEQLPPMHSAIQIQGQRAYALARQGMEPALSPRSVEVHELFTRELKGLEAVVELCVSKGYYVRAFARDIGVGLGVPAHLSALRRLASGVFFSNEAVSWPLRADMRLIPLAHAAERSMASVPLNLDGESKARRGRQLTHSDFASDPQAAHSGGLAAWLSPAGELIAVGERADSEHFRVIRGFSVET